MPKPKYPEHEKLTAAHDKSQAIGEFIEWIAYRKENFKAKNPANHGTIHLAQHTLVTTVTKFAPMTEPDAPAEMIPLKKKDWYRSDRMHYCHIQIQDLLSEFFGIDLVKLEKEKRQMLDSLREASAKTS